MKMVVLVLFIAMYWKNYASSQNDDVNPLRLSDVILELLDKSLRGPELQSYLNSLEYGEESIKEELLDKMALRIGATVKDRVEVVQNLQQEIIHASKANKGVSSILNCCDIVNTTFTFSFLLEVDITQSCVIISSQNDGSPLKDLSFSDIVKGNIARVPDIKLLYFGSETSTMRVYPSFTQPVCRPLFDIRLRPWYVQANSPKPKQVVVVIDKSGSMMTRHDGVSRMTLAKQAAKSVVSTLNPLDKFSVIAFSTSPETIRLSSGRSSCFSSQLVPATPQNRAHVNRFVDTIQAEGGTSYGNALLKAFDFFANEFSVSAGDDVETGSGSGSGDFLEESESLKNLGYVWNDKVDSVDRVILFMSDGAPEDPRQSIFNKLQQRSQKLNHSVLIMTYGVGDEDFSILRDIAVYNPIPSKKGEFVHISDPRRLRNEMSSYYRIFAEGGENITQPIWTVPYVNIQTFDLVSSASLPVYVDGEFIGVAGIIAGLRELFLDVSFLKLNPKSYAFLIDGTGLVIAHPLFPYNNPATTFVLATAFEQDPEFIPVFESMKRGENGTATFMTTRVDGMLVKKRVLSTYMWKKILHGNYSLCAVFPVNSTRPFLTSVVSYKPGSMLYHRFDLIPPSAPCNYYETLSSLNQSAVFFAYRAFTLSTVPATHMFTKEDIQGIVEFIEKAGDSTFQFKDYVLEEVWITDKAQSLWLDAINPIDPSINTVCRYIATDGGVFRIFPAVQMAETYDPTARVWYQQAIASPNEYIISAPYFLPVAKLHVVTFSYGLFLKRNQENKNESVVFGAIGIDIPLKDFYEAVTNMYPNNASFSRKTYLIDSAGDVIIEETKHTFDKVKHLAEVEPQITSILIMRGILQRISCSLVEVGFEKHFYKISMNESSLNFSYKVGEINLYDALLMPVPKTNGFLLFRYQLDFGVQRLNVESGHADLCQCSSEKCRTSWKEIDKCECPCVSTNPHYNPCENEYSPSSPPPCFPIDTFVGSSPQSDVSLGNLPVCFGLFNPSNTGSNASVIGVSVSLSVLVLIGIAIALFSIRYKQKQRKIAATKRFKSAVKRQRREEEKRLSARGSIGVWLDKMSRSFMTFRKNFSN